MAKDQDAGGCIKMKKIELDIECNKCGGTGLYVGMGEHDGAAVVCRNCDGTGKYHYVFTYEEFVERKQSRKVKRVFETNPGFGIGEGKKYKLEDYGGMPYKDWKDGKPFPPKSEMRKLVCPAWWYQSADYKKKPHWDECIGAGAFSDCKCFKNKEKCWAKFDNNKKNV
jgi:hypothetical protein